MDEIDNAQDREEIGLADAIRTARQGGPVIVATGRCLLCDDPVSEHQRWCDAACHSRYMREKYGK